MSFGVTFATIKIMSFPDEISDVLSGQRGTQTVFMRLQTETVTYRPRGASTEERYEKVTKQTVKTDKLWLQQTTDTDLVFKNTQNLSKS